MKKYSKVKKYFVQQLRRNERRMETKKAKRAFGTVALAILTILVLNQVISIVRDGFTPKILTIENKPLNWDDRAHSSEVPSSDPSSPEVAREKEYDIPVTVEEKIKEKFGEKGGLISAVFKAESGHNPRSMNWNCRYINERNETVSKACKPEDRGKAWSVDCGIAQINTIGQTCPEELFDVEHNLAVAKKMYDARGLNPWMAYLNGSYKKHL